MSEQSEAKRDGAKLQKNSGRGPIAKGDAIWHNFVVDYKEARLSFAINKEKWAKICSDSFRVDRSKNPVLKIILGEGNQKTRLALIEWAVLEEMVEVYEEYCKSNNEAGS